MNDCAYPTPACTQLSQSATQNSVPSQSSFYSDAERGPDFELSHSSQQWLARTYNEHTQSQSQFSSAQSASPLPSQAQRSAQSFGSGLLGRNSQSAGDSTFNGASSLPRHQNHPASATLPLHPVSSKSARRADIFVFRASGSLLRRARTFRSSHLKWRDLLFLLRAVNHCRNLSGTLQLNIAVSSVRIWERDGRRSLLHGSQELITVEARIRSRLLGRLLRL